jgi:hypothetical protein
VSPRLSANSSDFAASLTPVADLDASNNCRGAMLDA